MDGAAFLAVEQGAKDASAFAQYVMDIVVGDLAEHTTSFVDDLLTGSDSAKEHAQHLLKLAARLKRFNVKLSLGKCRFAVPEVVWIGRLWSKAGVSVPAASKQEVLGMRRPRNKDELRAAVASLQWWSGFIVNFSGIAAPLTNLLRERVRFEWGAEQEEAWTSLCSAVQADVFIESPLRDRPFDLYVDTSDTGTCALLTQEVDGRRRLVRAESSKLPRRSSGMIRAVGRRAVWCGHCGSCRGCCVLTPTRCECGPTTSRFCVGCLTMRSSRLAT